MKRRTVVTMVVVAVLIALLIGAWLLVGPERKPLTLFHAAVAPTGNLALLTGFAQDRAVLVRYDAAGFQLIKELRGQQPFFSAVDWNSQGHALVAARVNRQTSLYEYDGTSLRIVNESFTAETVNALRWSDDGARALLVGTGLSVYVYDRVNASLARVVLPGEIGSLVSLDWRPDGSEALAVGNGGLVLRYRSANSTLERLPATTLSVDLHDVDWAASGVEALIGGDEGALGSYDGISVQLRHIVPASRPGYRVSIEDVEWSPDGARALVAGTERKVVPAGGSTSAEHAEVVALYNGSLSLRSSGDSAREFRTGFGTEALGGWFADGSEALVISGDRLYRLAGGILAQAAQGGGMLYGLGISPTGGWGLACGEGSRVYKYEGGLTTDLTETFQRAMTG